MGLLPLPTPCVLQNNPTEPKLCGLFATGEPDKVGVEGRMKCGSGDRMQISVPFRAGRETDKGMVKATAPAA